MARVKRGVTARKRRKKVLNLAKGYRGALSRSYRPANQAVMRALSHSYKGRKLRKRDFRKLWITRINAASRSHGMPYSKFINGLKKSGIDINRKMLSEMAIHDAEGFAQLVDIAKSKV